ncbi:hypothetical protein LTR53_001165 [Teratosphaeriaceae sp. CCFEE 6253]|nr:hypothetical protein LTR53_001165 [Teratosphaeriaceae sp. CCFEE 6253]
MATPILVRAYSATTRRGTAASRSQPRTKAGVPALPLVSSYAFADILRSVESPDFQHALDGIAEICAKNRMSLADEYASHLPPLGEITSIAATNVRPQNLRPARRRALTSVPEVSSSGSEGSRPGDAKQRVAFSFRLRKATDEAVPRRWIECLGAQQMPTPQKG